MKVQDIYNMIDGFAPFSLQEKWDNSGLLAGDAQQEVQRVMLTLDITMPVVREAAQKHADLILAHHPVIWDPLKAVTAENPVWHLVRQNISAICAHTNLDIAEGGLNDKVGDMLAKALPMKKNREPLEQLTEGRALGRVGDLIDTWDAEALGQKLREVFRAQNVRYYAGAGAEQIRRIAWCTGSGGDMMGFAEAAGADALITGDCKHSIWAEAQNRNFTLFDCGHFDTEVPAVQIFAKLLHEKAPEIGTVISEAGTKPFFATLV